MASIEIVNRLAGALSVDYDAADNQVRAFVKFGFISVTRLGVGDYECKLTSPLAPMVLDGAGKPERRDWMIQATVPDITGKSVVWRFAAPDVIKVNTRDEGGPASDSNFNLLLWVLPTVV